MKKYYQQSENWCYFCPLNSNNFRNMNKYLLLFFTILYSLTLNAQNDCQQISPIISSTLFSPTNEVDSISGVTYTYYDLCQGQTLSLETNSDFPETTSFEWSFNNNSFEAENFEHTFNESGGYIITVNVSEEGCPQYSNQIRVRVGTIPIINVSSDLSLVCPGEVASLSSNTSSDVNFSIDIETDGWESEPGENIFSEPLFVPDGPNCPPGAYYSTITFNSFPDGQLITDVNFFERVCIEMEHSYVGDLTINLIGPDPQNTTVVLLEDQNITGNGNGLNNGGANLGEPVINDSGCDSINNPAGVGYIYCWSPNPSTTTFHDSNWAADFALGDVPASVIETNTNIYSAYNNSFENISNPINPSTFNGDWTLEVIDDYGIDNGWVFQWWIDFAPEVIPANWSFQNNIVEQYFLDEENMIANYGDSILINPEPGTHNYTYEVVDNFGCTFNEEIEITATSYINPNPIVTQEECGGTDGQIDLNISGGTPDYTVTWDSELTGEIISDISAGTYFYTITDGLGCEISGNETIQNIETGLTFDTEIFDDHCDQAIGEIILTPTNGAYPYNYTWSHSDTNQDSTANNLFEGTYEVFILDNDGCEGNLSLNIDNIDGPTAFFNQNFDTVTYVDGIVDFLNFSSAANQTELVNNQWSFGNGQFSNLESPSYNFNQIGNYFVQLTVTDNFGCSDSYIREVVAVEDYFIWTPSAFTPNGDGKNDLYIPRFHNIIEESFEFFIYDKWGKLVYETTDINTGWDGIRQDNGKAADNSSYSFLAKFITYKNELKKKTGSFLLLK